MAGEGANVSRGLGSGAAQVYNTSAPVNMYARLMQQQQLKRAAETKALTDELGKVTPEGIRQPDVKGFIDQYGRWRDKAIEANAEKNPVRKALLNQEAEREKLATLMYKDDSKNQSKGEQDRNKMLLDPNVRDRYDDSVIERVLKSSSLAKDDPNYVRDMNQFQIRPDLSKLTKDLDDLDKNLLQSSQWSVPITEKAKQGNIEGVYVYNTRAVDPKAQATAYASLFDLDRKFQAGLREMFPDLADLPKEQLKAQAIPLLVQQRVRTESSKPDFQANRDDRAYQLSLRRENRLSSEEGAINENINVTAKTFTGTRLPQKSAVTGKPILDKNKKQLSKGKGVTADFVAYSTVNPPSFQMPQLTQAFNIDKGKNEPINTEDAVNLTGIGYVKTKGGGTELKATIKVKGEEHIINLADLPVDIRTDKKYYLPVLRAVKQKFGEVSKQKTEKSAEPKKEQSKATKVTDSDFEALLKRAKALKNK